MTQHRLRFHALFRWTTLGYPEKVRSLFLSLRQQVIDITEIIYASANCATFPKVRGRIRESSKLRARITAIFFNQLGQFSEGHFASAVLVAMMVRTYPGCSECGNY